MYTANKWFCVFFVLIVATGLLLLQRTTALTTELNMLDVNSITMAIENNWPDIDLSHLQDAHSLSFTFVESGASIHTYIQHRNTIVPILISREYVGALVIFNDDEDIATQFRTHLQLLYAAQISAIVILAVLFAIHNYNALIKPFKKLKLFASRVAAGDLDVPLKMDKKNIFGAFSESFDLMRTQLAIAKESERQANISKKELIASLSHDIKTPAAAIKIMAELHQAKYGENPETTSIIQKIDQIDMLISNMFTATLEDLTQLKVIPTDVNTIDIAASIHDADYKKKLRPFTMPDCVLTIDLLRFQQILDNIFGNAYKYANTEMELTANINDGDYIITIRDFGPGVNNDEINLLCEKFYRAANANGHSGTGLGLHITSYFLSQMGARLEIKNVNGLCVIMYFPV